MNEQKLIADHKKVVELVSHFKKINLISTTGEPPQEYDIEYKLKGFGFNPKGDVEIKNRHRVKIQLPFGYPHFPPTIKPLSPIFHPDIDNHAILIADWWEGNPSLTDLVLHIGNMIAGKTYSKENPFNSKAADYYSSNENLLPLDSIETEEQKEEVKPSSRPINFSFLRPLATFIFVLALVAGAGYGGFLLFELFKINGYEKTLQNAKVLVNDQEYTKAKKELDTLLESLNTIRVAKEKRDSLHSKILDLTSSQSFVEGLKGNIKHGDQYLPIETVHRLEFLQELLEKAKIHEEKNNSIEAAKQYRAALDYATKNKLENLIPEVRKSFAQVQLKVLVKNSEQAHSSRNWIWATKQHQTLLDFLTEERDFLEDPDVHAARAEHLLLFDKIALYSQEASEAEIKGDLVTAEKMYTDLINTIGKSKDSNNPTLKNTLVDAMQKVAIVSEKLNIQKRKEWLLKNYKKIFQTRWSMVKPAALKSPQALFVKYVEGNMVFNVSCLEKSVGSVVKLRMHYQYNTKTGNWSIYKEN